MACGDGGAAQGATSRPSNRASPELHAKLIRRLQRTGEVTTDQEHCESPQLSPGSTRGASSPAPLSPSAGSRASGEHAPGDVPEPPGSSTTASQEDHGDRPGVAAGAPCTEPKAAGTATCKELQANGAADAEVASPPKRRQCCSCFSWQFGLLWLAAWLGTMRAIGDLDKWLPGPELAQAEPGVEWADSQPDLCQRAAWGAVADDARSLEDRLRCSRQLAQARSRQLGALARAVVCGLAAALALLLALALKCWVCAARRTPTWVLGATALALAAAAATEAAGIAPTMA